MNDMRKKRELLRSDSPCATPRWHGAIAVGDFKKGDQVLIAKQLGVVDSVNLDQLEKFWWVYK